MISHDISRYSRYQTVFLKLEEISYYLIYKKFCFGRAFCVLYGGSICKELSRPICFLPFLWYNLTN